MICTQLPIAGLAHEVLDTNLMPSFQLVLAFRLDGGEIGELIGS